MDANRNSGSQIERYLSVSPIIIAVLIGLGIPSAFFAMQYRHDLAAVTTMSRIHGSMVIDAINKNPEMWQFEEHKLAALVENRAAQSEAAEQVTQNTNRFSIYSIDGKLLASSNENSPPPPIITHDTPLFDATRHVGYFRVEGSLRKELIKSLGILLICVLIAFYVAFSLRTMPLRALRSSYGKLFHMAHHDSLTGLPNRKFLQDKLDNLIKASVSYEPSILLLFIDLDNFKDVNDSLGHAAGDELLKTLSSRMLSSIRESDTLARLGGDEFIILFPNYQGSAENIEDLVHKIRTTITQPVALSGRIVKVTSSIGIATYPEDGTTAEELLMSADVAMYDAKNSGKDAFRVYTKRLSEHINERLTLNDGIETALKNNEFHLVYQPLVAQKTKQIVGVEALIRWEHSSLGNIPPGKFIPRAEESGAIIEIGRWVLNEACRQNQLWQDQGHAPVTVAVNVSAKQFTQEAFVASVAAALETSGLAPQYLELEITESLIMTDVELAFTVMQRLKALGIKLAIDDFGTGYSSLSYLKKFPVSTLKIDKSFIDGISLDQDDESITRIIIALGHQLNMQVVAEGVETSEQAAFLDECDCDISQGFYFCRPVAPEQLFTKTRSQAEVYPAR